MQVLSVDSQVPTWDTPEESPGPVTGDLGSMWGGYREALSKVAHQSSMRDAVLD